MLMADITNHYEAGSCVFEAGSTQNGDVHITGGNYYQGGAKKPEAKPESVTDVTGAESIATPQLTNRQLVILFTALMDLSLDSEKLSKTGLSRLLSAVSGRSQEGLRKTIQEVSKNGYETPEARQDVLLVANLIENMAPRLANKLKNDALE